MENLPGLGRQIELIRGYIFTCRFKGLAFAALAAAIVSSLASMLNSTSTILQWISTNNILIKMLMIETTVNVDVFQGCSFIDCCYYATLGRY
jgi:SSS family solute:Na+ symporter